MASATADSSRATARSRVESSASPQDPEAGEMAIPPAFWRSAGGAS
jgi:hypothetical protein